MTDSAFHENEIREREQKQWLAYQQERLSPDKIISREKQWAQARLKSGLLNWQRCVLFTVAGTFLLCICATALTMEWGSGPVSILSSLGIVAGIASLLLFTKEAFNKPTLYKSRSWLLAEEQLRGAVPQ